MKRLLLILLFCSLHLQAQEPPENPTTIFVADGSRGTYTSQSSNIPTNWFLPGSAPLRSEARFGIGGPEHTAEVSTIDFFQSIRMKQSFDVSTTPANLTLSLKIDGGPLVVYLNGVEALNLQEADLPLPNDRGFRDFDLSPQIGELQTTGNLLAIFAQSSVIIPILHGTPQNSSRAVVGFDPQRVRLGEEESGIPVRLFRSSSNQVSILVYWQDSPSSDVSLADFSIVHDGKLLPLRERGGSTYFVVPLKFTEQSTVIQVRANDDIHAEAEEVIPLAVGTTNVEPLQLIIRWNDTVVTRTTAEGEGSLRQAIENAELGPGIETIRFDDADGIPFSLAPVTVNLDFGSPGRYGLREGFVIEGPKSPGRVTIQGNGGPLFFISGAGGAARTQDLTLRRLVIRGSSRAVESVRYTGTMLIEDCEFIDNELVLDIYNSENAAVIRRCLFTENTRDSISWNSGLPPNIENCTFSNNQGTDLDLRNAVEISHCSFIGENRFASGRALFRNCLLAGTGDIKIINNDYDQGGNLFAGISEGGEPVIASHPGSLSTSLAETALGELGFHGGFTRTIPILSNSPALDLGLPVDSESPEFDQRGDPYFRRVGPKPDAGAYELQFDSTYLAIGLETGAVFDELAGLYFQFAIIHNTSPWTIPGARLQVTGLPDDAVLYNATGEGFVDLAGPISPMGYRIVVLQYLASRPDLNLSPHLQIELLPEWDSMDSSAPPIPEIAMFFGTDGKPCLEFRTNPNSTYQIEISENLREWHSVGPILSAESQSITWKSPEPKNDQQQFYRVVAID